MGLVPNRECGGCTVCCEQLTIDEPELKKLPGILCEHCSAGAGCAIYERRPTVCRTWHCGWRELAILDDDWRPDRSGIIISIGYEESPSGFEGKPVIKVELFGGAGKATWTPLVNFVASMIYQGIPVFMTVPILPGYEAGRVFLNDVVSRPLASRDFTSMVAVMEGAAESCTRHPVKKIKLD
jgi:hypothetical protein